MKKELYVSPSIEVIETKAEALLAALSPDEYDPTGTGDSDTPSSGGSLTGGGANRMPRRSMGLWDDDEE